MITASEIKRKPTQIDPVLVDPLKAYLMERRRALLTELIALERLLGLSTERKETIDKS